MSRQENERSGMRPKPLQGSPSEDSLSPRAVQKRKAIMKAAWRIFSEQGYERASVEAIVALCGGSKATVYSYFGSKADLFLEVAVAKAVELSGVAFEGFPSGKRFEDAVYDFSVRYLRFYLNSELVEVFRLAVAESRQGGFGAYLYERCFKTSWGKVAAYLEKEIAPERLLSGGGWTAAMHLRGLLDGDILLQSSWGVLGELAPEEYERLARAGVTAFLRVYAPERATVFEGK